MFSSVRRGEPRFSRFMCMLLHYASLSNSAFWQEVLVHVACRWVRVCWRLFFFCLFGARSSQPRSRAHTHTPRSNDAPARVSSTKNRFLSSVRARAARACCYAACTCSACKRLGVRRSTVEPQVPYFCCEVGLYALHARRNMRNECQTDIYALATSSERELHIELQLYWQLLPPRSVRQNIEPSSSCSTNIFIPFTTCAETRE